MLAAFLIQQEELAGSNLLLMTDKVYVHISLTVRDYLNNADIPQMDWPTNSPDLNPTEAWNLHLQL